MLVFQGPSLPTVITVQAPAGIGKTSMLKYMCMKWGCQELWTENFDVLLFVEFSSTVVSTELSMCLGRSQNISNSHELQNVQTYCMLYCLFGQTSPETNQGCTYSEPAQNYTAQTLGLLSSSSIHTEHGNSYQVRSIQ